MAIREKSFDEQQHRLSLDVTPMRVHNEPEIEAAIRTFAAVVFCSGTITERLPQRRARLVRRREKRENYPAVSGRNQRAVTRALLAYGKRRRLEVSQAEARSGRGSDVVALEKAVGQSRGLDGQAPLQPCPIARHIGGVSPSLP